MKKLQLVVLCTVTALMSSCMLQKVEYVKDMIPNKEYLVTQKGEIKIQKDDRLRITVTSKDPELTIPFNMNGGNYSVDVSSMRSLGTVTSEANRSVKERGYLVDQNGDIEFPILGKLKAQGLTQTEFAEFIKQDLISNQHIKDPMVSVEILNLRIIVLSDLGTNVLNIEDKRITILEAIARTNLIGVNSRLRSVQVIRTEGDTRKMYSIDLGSVKLFDSPVYNLQQNDIVYIQQKSGIPNQAYQSALSIWWSIVSVVSITLSFTSLINK